MKKIQNKTYSDLDGRSFDYLKDKNGQFNLKDVAAHLEKKASVFTAVIQKMANKGMLTYNSREFLEPEPRDFGFGSTNSAAFRTNKYGEDSSRRTSSDVIQRHAPEYQQTVVNDENKMLSDKTVYPNTTKQ
jgi:hypothetical protein